jgi:SAM-dependent methyltransferase/DNA-directed RNA polymerase subunit RPC12/RpoP
MRDDIRVLFRCPRCGGRYAPQDDAKERALTCLGCGTKIPVSAGIPRFVTVPEDKTARRTQASFGYEWTHFSDWKPSGETNFNDYFQGVDLASLTNRAVLDAGCGMGRHARHVARSAGRLVAIDFSRAIDQAASNTADLPNVQCIQGDLMALPLADEAFDFVYSLGVLHHIDQTERAIGALVRKLKAGGRLRIYLYWKRHGWKGRLLQVANSVRPITTNMPFPLLRAGCRILSAGLFAGVVLPYRGLSLAGFHGHEDWPLFVYSKYPFNVLFNDQFDRFSAPLEKRYDADEARRLLESAGLVDVTVRPCFGWIVDGTKSA